MNHTTISTTDNSPHRNKVSDSQQSLNRKTSLAKTFSMVSYVGLLLLFITSNLIHEHGSLFLWFAQSLPLLIFIPALFQQHFKTYIWLCFATLLYFIVAVVNVMSPTSQWIDFIQLLLCIILFVASMLSSRWIQHLQLYENHSLQEPQ